MYIILARKTREGAYQDAYDRLKRAFPTWDQLLAAPRRRVEKLVFSGAFVGKKTDSLFGALGAIREQFGACTLDLAWTNPFVATSVPLA